ncbi:hypothetical protein RZE82_08600 [Mollicutes bacterium LVI A0039]|nr:hypothetical protein RZE82_08600 [Mollicutes bacterium LVI A0039]
MVFLYEGKLNDLDISIAQRIEKNPEIVTDNNIFRAADILEISASKLTKYCQKIGLKGFKEIKYKLDEELIRTQLQRQADHCDFKITSILDQKNHKHLIAIPKLLASSSKIIIVSNSSFQALTSYLAIKLRLDYHQAAINYTFDQDFSFEYLDDQVLTILVDETSQVTNFSSKWYRPNQNYIHITAKALKQQADYYPLSIINSEIKLPFDAAVMLIFSWLMAEMSKK